MGRGCMLNKIPAMTAKKSILLTAAIVSVCFSFVVIYNKGCYGGCQDDTVLTPLPWKPLQVMDTQWPTAAYSSAQMHHGNATKHYKSFVEALTDRASADGTIMLSYVDSNYLDMGLNLYETSFLQLGLNHYLFAVSDSDAFHTFQHRGIAAYLFTTDKEARAESKYGSANFARKTHFKTWMILEALQLGLSVLILDVDIVLLRDPLPYLTCADCDMQIQNDGPEPNSGFYLARPTAPCIALHRTAMDIGNRTEVSNQKAIDRTMEQMAKDGKLKYKVLDTKYFPYGLPYFEWGHRMFAGDNPCKDCVMVHNNWIVGGPGKQYRFKELLLWVVDNNGYYSDPHALYLVYDNPADLGAATTIDEEVHALKGALAIARLLRRILILPTFHCYGCTYDACKKADQRCHLGTHLKVSAFDKQFAPRYREHVFLQHPKVPQSVIGSQSEAYLIESTKGLERAGKSEVGKRFVPRNPGKGATPYEILEWFGGMEAVSVLRFHSLYGAFAGFGAEHPFDQKLSEGIVRSNYRQYE